MGHKLVYIPGPPRDADLNSIEYVKIIDVVCEGEIEGLVNGAKSIYIDGVPAQNNDIINGDIITEGSANFEEVRFEINEGTQSQEYIPGFAASEAEKAISNAEVLKDTPVTVLTESSTLTSARVNVRIPRLSNTNTGTGDVNGTSISYEIGLQSQTSGSFITQTVGEQYTPFSYITDTTATTSQAATGIDGVVQWTHSYNDPGDYDYTPINITYDIEYQVNPAGGWILWEQVNRSGYSDGQTITGYNYNGSVPLPESGLFGGGSVGGGQFIIRGLPSDVYDIRITNITGSSDPWGYGSVKFAYLHEWVPSSTVNITGKSTVAFTKSHLIDLTQPALDDGPWEIRVTRLTDDSTSDFLSNKTFFDSLTEIVDHKLSYPNTAYVGVEMDSTQFQSVPSRGYELKLLKVKVPSNYNPITRVYTGMWDGTFKADKEWTDNPAWCFYDLLTNTRYGLGGFLDESTHVDKSALYTIGQYCDELVTNGQGYSEPRFTCNLYLQNREQAYKVLNDMASIFRGMLYWSNNQVSPIQDSPSSIVSQFTNADVVDGDFLYEGSAARARHTVALVTWNDPSNAYKQSIEYVEDSSGIALKGLLETEVMAVGCTSRSQAHRVGKWLLYSERYETETVTFKTGLEGIQLFPGDIIKTSDQHRVGARHGGRITGVTSNTVALDSPLTIDSGTNTITNVLADGTLVDSTITNGAGTYSTVSISPAFTTQPAVNSLWVVAANNVTPEEWRVVGVTEEEKNVYSVTALEYNSSKYGFVEDDLALEKKQASLISNSQAHVTNLQTEDSLYLINNTTLAARLEVSWEKPLSAVRYKISWTLGDGNSSSAETIGTNYEILNVPVGAYSISVIAYNSLGVASIPVTISGTTLGITVTPSDVSNFSIVVNGLTSFLEWDAVTEANLAYYQIRFSPDVVAATWEDSTLLVERVGRDTTTASVPTLIGTYFIKTVSISGTFNPTATSLVQTSSPAASDPTASSWNLVETFNEDPNFDGLVNGSRMYVCGAGDIIYQYNLSTPEEINTAVFTTGDQFDVSTQVTSPRTIEFNPTGTRMFVLSLAGHVYEYDLGTAWDVKTAVYNSNTYNATAQTTSAVDMTFSVDGTSMYILSSTNETVYMYTLPTAWDVTSITGWTTGYLFDVSSEETDASAITFNPDGLQMFAVGATFDSVFAYDMTTAWDIRSSSCTYSGDSFSVNTQEAVPQDLIFSAEGDIFYIVGDTDDVHMYELTTPWDISTGVTFTGGDLFDVSTQEAAPLGVNFSRPYVKVAGSTLKLSNPDTVTFAEYNFFNTVDIGAAYPSQFVIDIDTSAETVTNFMADWSTLSSVTILSGTIVDPSLANVDLKMRTTNDDPAASPTWSAWQAFVVGDYNNRAFEFKACLSTLDANITPLISGLDIFLSMIDRVVGEKDLVSGAGDRVSTATTSSPLLSSHSARFNSDGTKMYVGYDASDILYDFDLSNPWELASASPAGNSYNVSGQDNSVYELTFSTFGHKMYILGNENETVYMYDLPVAWDISSITGFTALDEYDPASEDTNPHRVKFSYNGNKMYVLGGTNNTIYRYNLPTYWDITTAGFTALDLFDYSSYTTAADDFAFSTDGTKLYILGGVGTPTFEERIWMFDLSTAWDVTTAGFTSGDYIDVDNYIQSPSCISFSTDGSLIQIGDGNKQVVQTWTLPTPWDIKTAVNNAKDISFTFRDEMLTVNGLFYSPANDKMYAMYSTDEEIFEYNLTTPGDITSAVYTPSDKFFYGTEVVTGYRCHFSTPGTEMYIHDASNDTVYMYVLSTAWDVTSASYTALDLFDFSTESTDMFGFTLSDDGTKMYMTTNGTYPAADEIYQYNLSTAWDIKSAVHTAGEVFTISLLGYDQYSRSLAFGNNGVYMYITDSNADRINRYTLTTAWDVTTAVQDSFLDISSEHLGIYMTFNAAGTKMYVGAQDILSMIEYTLSAPWDITKASSAGSLVTYDVPFHIVPSIAISSRDLTEGDFYEISNKTTAGFHIVFRGASGEVVERTFDYISKGY